MTESRRLGRREWEVVIILSLLLLFGLVMVFSTSAYKAELMFGNGVYWFLRQSLWAVLGMIFMFFLSRMDYRRWKDKPGLLLMIYVAMSILLFVTLLLGSVTKGSKRWLSLGPLSFQPSELSKLVLIMFLAGFLAEHEQLLKKTKGIFLALLITIPLIGPVAVENASTSIILLAVAGVMIFVSSPWYKRFLLMILLGGAAGGLIIGTRAYRLERFVIWMDPENHPKGLQTVQALYGIGSGGLFGKGLGNSMQKLGFLPEPQNDMIFSIICEELGMFGAMSLMVLFFLLLYTFFRIGLECTDLFGFFIVTGVTAHLGIQIFINIAVVTNTIPNTGIPLPFISYGGSSLFFLLGEVGMVLSVAKYGNRRIK